MTAAAIWATTFSQQKCAANLALEECPQLRLLAALCNQPFLLWGCRLEGGSLSILLSASCEDCKDIFLLKGVLAGCEWSCRNTNFFGFRVAL